MLLSLSYLWHMYRFIRQHDYSYSYVTAQWKCSSQPIVSDNLTYLPILKTKLVDCGLNQCVSLYLFVLQLTQLARACPCALR